MAEYLSMPEAEDKFASKGKANTALGFGIAGLATGLLGGMGNILGLGGNNTQCDYPTAYQVAQKECEDNIALTRSIFEARITDLNEKFDLYTRLNDKITVNDKAIATLQAQLPLMFQLANSASERYTDDKVSAQREYQTGVNFMFQRELDQKINGTMGLPWSDIITGVPTMPQCSFDVTCPKRS